MLYTGDVKQQALTAKATETAWILLGDVVDSRSIGRRDRFESAVDAELRQLNRTYDGHLLADFTRLKGIDEIGAVLGSVRSLVEIRRDLTLGLHPEEIRIAVVRGAVNDLSESDVSQMDGEGFASAADELEEIEAAGRTFGIRGLPLQNNLISELVNVVDHIRSGWTESRVRAVRASRRTGSQAEAAELLGVSRQAVNQQLNSHSVQLVRQAESVASEELSAVSVTTGTEGF